MNCHRKLSLIAILLAIFGWTAAYAQPAQHTYVVTAYGAVGDGKSMNTDAIRKTIEACAAAGGGQVVFPPGTWLTGPIHLASNMELCVQGGATVLFSRHIEDYPPMVADFEGESEVRATSPLTGENLTNVSITGAGAFDGQGDAWRAVKRGKLGDQEWNALIKSGGVVDEATNTWWPSHASLDGQQEFETMRKSDKQPQPENYVKFRELLRPPLVTLSNCQHVVLDGPTFRNSPNWNVHVLLTDDLTIRNCTMFNESWAQNSDGMDIDSCRNVLITNDKIDAGDDGICLKSGRDEAGRKRGRPTENVVITRCLVGAAHGGIVIGSEMSGGVRKVYASDCAFNGTDAGIRMKSTRGRGGTVEDIHLNNISMSHIHGAAIDVNMFYMTKNAQPEPVSERTPIFRDIHITNVTCDGAKQAIEIRGLPEMPISDVTLENVRITADAPGQIIDAKNITMRHVNVDAADGAPVSLRNVQNLILDDVVGVQKP